MGYFLSLDSLERVANPVRITVGSVSPLAGIQAIHDCADSADSPASIKLTAILLIVGRSVLRDKLDLAEAFMILCNVSVTVAELLRGKFMIVTGDGGLGSKLG